MSWCSVSVGYTPDCQERWVAEDPVRKNADRDDFARDRARIVHSASLRRLAMKTQVVQPGSDDFVRNRLTHSLEVAQIGREFGAALGCNADVVDAACLAHDLGHPPFGHNGEATLDRVANRIGGFEGNAQTLRVLTRLEAKRFHADGRSAGLNLTRATLDAVVKYPWARGEGPVPGPKFNAYADDAEVFAWVRSRALPGRRCIEAQVMDWADDVGYCVHDLEDAVASGRLDLRALRSPADVREVARTARELFAPSLEVGALEEALGRLLATGLVPERFDGSREALAAMKDMTSSLIGRFCRVVEEETRERHGVDRLTRYAADLVVSHEVRAEVAMLKATATRYVMMAEDRLAVQEGERAVVAALVAAYRERPERMDPVFRHDAEAADGDAGLLRVVVDQVSSLSDQRALGLHRRWC